MSKLFYRNKPLIGLDISQTGIKVMAINASRWHVSGYGSLDLDPSKVQSALENRDDNYLASNISSLLKENIIGDLDSDHVVVGIPTSRTYSRTFPLPLDQVSHLSDAVNIEVDQYIPMPISSLYVDYSIIEKNKDKSMATVIMTAAPKLIIDNCVSAVRSAGLVPIVTEPSINAVARVLELSEEGGHLVTLVVDINSASTDIAILDGGAIRVTGGVNIGGNTFTLSISKKMDIPLEKAHQYKIVNGLNSSPKQKEITSALKSNLDRIATEMRKVMRYYSERMVEDRKIEQVLIVGGGANVPGIGDYFTNELIMPVRVASPWQKLNFGKLPEPNKQFFPRYISVAGLASVSPEEVWNK